MSETMQRATNDQELSQDMLDFATYFAKKSGIIK
jgi:hypothetical protein